MVIEGVAGVHESQADGVYHQVDPIVVQKCGKEFPLKGMNKHSKYMQ